MAESSNPTQILSPPDVTPKEEPVILNRPESPNPFLPADQVEFNFDQITFTTNNKCLGGKTGGHDQISNKDVIILYCLANGVQDVPMAPKAPKTSLHSEKKVLQGRKPRAKSGLKRKQFSKHTSKSQTEASKSKAGHLENENLSKAGGPTSLGATSEEGAHPQLSSYSIAEADLGKSAPNDSIPHQQDQTKSAGDGLKTGHTDLGTNKESRSDDISRKIKLEDLSDLMKDTRSAFFTPDSLNDEPIIVTDESEEDEAKKHEEAHAASHNEPEDTLASHPPSPKSVQLQELKD
ncbi:hypothetical protein Tco_1056739 [Tanacetum coccineum]|uniref:Uncharacterized protein n=1 Tax=Tanacetum coccineum TaxID=301880 RepID=A0ABQ5H3F4_9ASTR